MDRINIIQRMPDVDIHSTKDMKELIDKIFQAIDVATAEAKETFLERSI